MLFVIIVWYKWYKMTLMGIRIYYYDFKGWTQLTKEKEKLILRSLLTNLEPVVLVFSCVASVLVPFHLSVLVDLVVMVVVHLDVVAVACVGVVVGWVVGLIVAVVDLFLGLRVCVQRQLKKIFGFFFHFIIVIHWTYIHTIKFY